MDQNTGRYRGYGFVSYENEHEAADTKDRADGLELNGSRLCVDFFFTKGGHTPTPRSRLKSKVVKLVSRSRSRSGSYRRRSWSYQSRPRSRSRSYQRRRNYRGRRRSSM